MQDAATRLLEHCLWIPGVLHLAHHVIGETLDAMRFKQSFLTQLRTVTGFFKFSHLRERFVHNCLRGPDQRHQILFDDWPATYIDWRWGTLIAAFKEMVPLEDLLFKCAGI